MVQQNGSLTLEYLSNTELYYSHETDGSNLIISGEEKNHIIRVMRHQVGDSIYITDGKGGIYNSRIITINKDTLTAVILGTTVYEDFLNNFIFCIPKLRNPERFEFALEKCTELGITRFIIYNSVRGISKGDKKERWEKIVTSAMKQSLRSFKPELIYINGIKEINDLRGTKIFLEQNSDRYIEKKFLNRDDTFYFIFGPEGGFDISETGSIPAGEYYKISPNRLRTETAILKTASIISI
jgi:16S rRNA (uracil1498-N3)-methyltransferase